MYAAYHERLRRILELGEEALLRDTRVGLEKEALRVNDEGLIARTPHPPALGSALTHPWITTDFSEALLEFITPPFAQPREALDFLNELHVFTYQHIGDELLWSTSMPCVLEGEAGVPVALYGSSNAGRMKTIYRLGLGHRYGRIMQVIAGVHFNFSVSEDFWPLYGRLIGSDAGLRELRDAGYFGMIRNLQRLGWLVPYLFGASPAICRTFLGGKPTTLAEFDEGTCYEPYATSLRMGDIGYQNRKEEESGIKASYDSLEAYVRNLSWAINTPSPRYERIGVEVDGEYRQLNANILQIENEYYSTVRPKAITRPNEKPSLALRRGGVAYVELRSLDVNAFEPLGIDLDQLHFLQALMLFALLCDSPCIDELERLAIDHNQGITAHRGREPGLMLMRGDQSVALSQWAMEIIEAMEPLCQVLDGQDPDRPYSRALEQQRRRILDPELTPSARMLAEMSEQEEDFHSFARRVSEAHALHFRTLALDAARSRELEQMALESLRRQAEMEENDEDDLPTFLRRYFEQR